MYAFASSRLLAFTDRYSRPSRNQITTTLITPPVSQYPGLENLLFPLVYPSEDSLVIVNLLLGPASLIVTVLTGLGIDLTHGASTYWAHTFNLLSQV